jgi:3-hydroxyacyl-[acyl-carrier-protein] dehydratase
VSEGPALPLDVTAIMRLLPHRYPFLLIDRVTEFEGETCRAIKNVTINEPFFVGHFPGHPVMPGVLILEAMAQTAAVHACLKLGKQAGEQAFYLVSMDKARFRKPVVPGDQLVLTTSLLRGRGRIWKFRGEVHVAGQLVSEAEFMATLPSALAQDGEASADSDS